MSKIEFELNLAGVSELMKSSEMQAVLNEKASAIVGRCGDGFEQDIYVGRKRANAKVWPETYRAKGRNKRDNTLLKAVR